MDRFNYYLGVVKKGFKRKMILTVSLVTYNSEKFIKDCLTSIQNNKISNQIKVVVVDNNSTDNTLKVVKKNFPKVKIIENKNNLGFGRAHNQVFSQLTTPYVLILNPDTLVDSNSLDQMVEFMEAHPECGISTGKELDFSNNLHPNAGDLPKGLSLISWIFNLESLGVKENFHRTDKDFYNEVSKVGWVSGSFMLIRKNLLDILGGFDESYFMYFEDVDLCFRAWGKKSVVMLNPKVLIKHLGGASSKEPQLRQWSGEIKGLIFFYSENFGLLESLILKFLIILGLTIRMIAFSLLGRLKTAQIYGKILSQI